MITDIFLEQVASALASETFTVPDYLTVGTEVITPAVTDTTLSGEIGPRVSSSITRTVNAVEFASIRSSTSVIDSTGDSLTSSALFSASSGGDLFTSVVLPSITHTSTFDIEFDWTFTVNRRS